MKTIIMISLLVLVLASGCASRPPHSQDDICRIFDQHPSWYRAAKKSEQRWGTPVAVKMAFVQQESAFRKRAKPPRRKILGFIPGSRPSSAKGYPQAQDPAWQDYRRATGRRTARRTKMAHALDFIGWYNSVSQQRLGLAPNDARNLYLAYHEGHTGYQRGNWRNNRSLQTVADRVSNRANRYSGQLASCEQRFRRRGLFRR